MPISVRLDEETESLADLIGKEFSGQGNLAIDSEKILREAFRREK